MSVACATDAAATADAGRSGFVPADDNARWRLQGEVTTATAARIYEDSSALPLPSGGIVDCAGVTLVDSTAVALLMALRRRAMSERKPIAFENVPAALLALASVYGVADLLR
jgi:phospholipid transport system transporter-binding protein